MDHLCVRRCIGLRCKCPGLFDLFDFLVIFKNTGEFYQATAEPELRFGDVIDGIQYIFRHKGISSILILLLAGDALGASIFYMTPAFSEQILGMGAAGVSIILASKGIGATIAALWIAYGGQTVATSRNMLRGFICFVFSAFAIFFFENIYLCIFAFVIMGMAAEAYHTIIKTLVQLSVTEEQRSRVMGTLFMFGQFASGVGTYFIGYYALSYGLVTPTLLAATICLLVWLMYFNNRSQIEHGFTSSIQQE